RELTSRGLEVTAVHPTTRRVKVAGTLGDLSRAFGTTLRQVSSPDPSGHGRVTHRYREGPLYVPAALAGVVTAVLGLDTRPQAQPHFRTPRDAAAAQGTSYYPNQVAQIYDFPANTTGAGQTVAVIELGGGFTTSDLDAYFGGLNIAVPSITAASVDGASNNPGDTSGASVEVNLDIDVIGAAAPGAAQVVYFAPNNGDQGFVDAISNAAGASPAPIAISISWGQSEDSWTAQGLSAMNAAMSDAAAMGITVCVAAGDNGSSDGVNDGQVHVDFPASSPYALACGGTKLLADAATGTVSSEVVWNELAAGEGAGGGGVSDQFAQPTWQANAGVGARAAAQPAAAAGGAAAAADAGGAAAGADAEADPLRHRRHHGSGSGSGGSGSGGSGSGSGGSGGGSSGTGWRGVPDVAGNADPVTGYQIYSGGQAQVVGGTSAVAPLWSALIARLAQATGKRFGLIQPLLYAGVSPGADVPGFRDITSGNNGAYAAGPGWDACSGLGSPDGTALLTRLQGP
ncbi:MAG TPA: S53 family peptidase, partial [Streptosporangiaceae bacterium]|nr:S53 family peptidase [Streptosporangiaceae bacterium]